MPRLDMIEGAVSENLEATIHLTLLGVDREVREVKAIIDAGFTSYLTLPIALIRRLNLSRKMRGSGTDGGDAGGTDMDQERDHTSISYTDGGFRTVNP